MRIILIQLPLPANERHKKVLPLGLAYLAAYLKKQIPPVKVTILDGQARNMSLQQISAEILSRAGGRTVAGITYWTCQSPAAHSLSKALKETNRDITIVHGGIHATIFPRETLDSADYCVLHEGEETFAELVHHLMDGKPALHEIRGIAYMLGREKTINPQRPFIDDLDSIPLPAWDLLDMQKYDSPLHVVGGKRLPIIGSRGCPYGCTYCGSPLMWKKRVRWRSPQNVLSEIKASIEHLGIPQFHFWDDNLMLNREFIERLCQLILLEKLPIRWTGLTRASHIVKNGDLMGLMKEAGCIGLEVGIESANPATFGEIGKNEDLEQIMKVAELHKRHSMYPMFTYMAFNPGETIYGYWRQAAFIDRILEGLPPAQYFHPTPFPLYIGQFCTAHPGTELFRKAKEKGIVLAERWEDYHHHQINFVPFSLLNDVPLRLAKKLTGLHHKMLNYVIQVALWMEFNPSCPIEQQRKELARFSRYANAYYQLAKGRKSVGEIAHVLRRRLKLNERESLRWAAFLTYMLAQMGLIRSAKDVESTTMKERAIARSEQIPNMLTPAEGSGWLNRIRDFIKG